MFSPEIRLLRDIRSGTRVPARVRAHVPVLAPGWKRGFGLAEGIVQRHGPTRLSAATVGCPGTAKAQNVQILFFQFEGGAADELIIVTRPGSETDWLKETTTRETLERLRLPVTHLAIDQP
jgi:hypothetical protein